MPQGPLEATLPQESPRAVHGKQQAGPAAVTCDRADTLAPGHSAGLWELLPLSPHQAQSESCSVLQGGGNSGGRARQMAAEGTCPHTWCPSQPEAS